MHRYQLGKTSIKKKRFLSGIARITPPPDPNSGNLVLFFRTSKFNAVQVPTGLWFPYLREDSQKKVRKMWGGEGDILTT